MRARTYSKPNGFFASVGVSRTAMHTCPTRRKAFHDQRPVALVERLVAPDNSAVGFSGSKIGRTFAATCSAQ